MDSSRTNSNGLSWEKPSGSQPPELLPQSSYDLPPGWERRFDTYGRQYFCNYSTQQTQWEHPINGSSGNYGWVSNPVYQPASTTPLAGYGYQAPINVENTCATTSTSSTAPGPNPTVQTSGAQDVVLTVQTSDRSGGYAADMSYNQGAYNNYAPNTNNNPNQGGYNYNIQRNPGWEADAQRLNGRRDEDSVEIGEITDPSLKQLLIDLGYWGIAGRPKVERIRLAAMTGAAENKQQSDQYMANVVDAPAPMDAGTVTCGDICVETASRNKILLAFSVLLWCLLPVLIYGVSASSEGEYLIPTVLPFAIVYFLYSVLFMLFPGYCPCCPASEGNVDHLVQCGPARGGMLINESVHEFMVAKPQDLDGLESQLAAIKKATPVITLFVSCSHTTTSTDNDGNTSSSEVVTFRASQRLPIRSVRDVGVAPRVYSTMLEAAPERVVAIKLEKEKNLSPEDSKWLENMKRIYYLDNAWRDWETHVWYEYSYEEQNLENSRLIVVVKTRTGETINDSDLHPCLLNRCCLWSAMLSTLYFPYILLYKILIRSFYYTNVKVLTLDESFIVPPASPLGPDLKYPNFTSKSSEVYYGGGY